MSVVTTFQKPTPDMDMRNLTAYVLITIAYVVSGKLGLMLALPPGYASPIFPPAGIAVAAVLIGGRKTLPWIFIGSLLLNVWAGYSDSGQINAMGFAVAALIAIASMLQAAAGGWGLRRVIGYPAAFDHGAEVLRFLLLAPVICLISASLSVSGLWLLGIIEQTSFATNWAVWWVGDTLGLVVVHPLVMMVAGEPRALWKRRMRTVALPILLFFALFVVIFLRVNLWEHEDSLMEFRQLSQHAVNQIQTKLEEQEFLLEQTAALFIYDTNNPVTREEFHRFVEKSLIRFPMVQALEWISLVDAAHRASFEDAQCNDIPGFEIRERNAAGQLRRAGERNSYYPVTYVEPFVGNEPALGFDLASNSERRAALTEAIQSGTAVMSSSVYLVQERQQQAGVLLILAINPHDKESGAVVSILRMGDFMDKLLLATRPALYTRLIDLGQQKTLYDTFQPGDARILYTHAFDFGTRHYLLETAPTPAYVRQHHGWQSWGVLAAGLLGTGLLGALLLLGTGYTSRIEAQVEDRTRKLKESESRFRNTLENAPIGMAIGAPDGRLMQVNLALCVMLGYEKSELERLTFSDLVHPEDRDRSLASVQQLLDGKISSYRSENRYLRKDGQVVWVQLAVSIEKDDSGAPLYLIGQIEGITERKQLEQQLSRRLRHRDIMERITQISLNGSNIEELLGTVLDEILAVFNADRAWFLYPCDPDAPSWSVPMERTRPEWPGAFSRGMGMPMTPEVSEVFREVLASTEPLPYGPAALRGIPAAVSEQFSIRSQIQMALRPKVGSPWVMGLHHCAQARAYEEDELLIFKDIGQRIADALSSMIMLKNLRESEARYRAVTYTASDAIIIADSTGNIVSWNRGAEIIFGYSEAEVGGQSLTVLMPERYRDRHLAGMNQVLSGGEPHMIGSGAVELEGLRKSGSEFPLEISLNKWESADGQFFSGIIRDITERKQVETELRIAAIAFESQDGMMITDANNVILRINHAFTEITGYTAEEAVGQTPHLLNSGRHDAAFYAAMWESIRRCGSWQGEIWNMRKNGEVYPEQLTVTEVRGEAGEVNHYVATLNDITHRKMAEEQIRNLAFYDVLTQLPNRRLLNDRLGQTMTASKRSGHYGALMFLDLDNFKPLNDKYGHTVGDLLLIEVARRIGSCVREADTVARFGGDEFVVMLSELDVDKAESTAQANIVAEKIRITLAEPYVLTIQPDGEAKTTVEHHCTSSIGVVLFINHEAGQEDILKWADMAMYQAKEAGRNQIRFYVSEA